MTGWPGSDSANFMDDAHQEQIHTDARIAELEAALRSLVDAVKAGEAVSGAEAMGAAEAVLANQK